MTLHEVLAAVSELEADGHQQFEDLARAIASGETPPAKKVIATLEAAGKTKNDLANLVGTLERREQLRAELAELQAFREERAKLKEQIEEHNRELELAVERHREACMPLQQRIREIGDVELSRGQHQQELFNSCQCPVLRAEYNDVRSRHLAAVQASQVARKHLERIKGERSSANYSRFADERAKIENAISRAQQALNDAMAVADELREQGKAIEAKMREW